MTAVPTALQQWLAEVLDVLNDARDELDPAEYQVLLDIVAVRLAHDYLTRIGLLTIDDDDEAAA